MNSAHGPVKLVAMADLVEGRLTASLKALSKQFGDRIDVPKDRQFIGFDAYRKAVDCLGLGDVAMLTNFAAFRPLQLEYAVQKGVNVFMEKSFAPDVPGLRRLIKAGEEADKKNLKIAAGLQWRHSANRQELIRRIRDGALGEVQLIRAYRVHACGSLGKKPPDQDELLWQIRNFVHFLWVSGGLFAEMNIHQIDEICWIKDAWPVTAHGVGGRAAGNDDCGQNLDSLSIESWDAEWNVLLDNIRNDRPQNETRRAAYSNVADLMGRAAVHSGKVITWDEAMASDFQFCPNIDAMDYGAPPPVRADAEGRYPVPVPGVWTEI